MIDALIFDFDGVIIDTETPDFTTWQEEFCAYGAELDRGLWEGFIGGGLGSFDIYQHLEDLTGEAVDRDQIQQRRRKRYLDLVEASPVLPGVLQYIAQARRLGLKLGVASSSNCAWVQGHLERRGLLGEFLLVVGREDVSAVKPDPELFLAAVEGLGSRRDSRMAIEDSANGVAAAKAAGLFCVAVPNPMTKDMSLGHADLRLEALTDMALSEVLALAAAGGHAAEAQKQSQ